MIPIQSAPTLPTPNTATQAQPWKWAVVLIVAAALAWFGATANSAADAQTTNPSATLTIEAFFADQSDNATYRTGPTGNSFSLNNGESQVFEFSAGESQEIILYRRVAGAQRPVVTDLQCTGTQEFSFDNEVHLTVVVGDGATVHCQVLFDGATVPQLTTSLTVELPYRGSFDESGDPIDVLDVDVNGSFTFSGSDQFGLSIGQSKQLGITPGEPINLTIEGRYSDLSLVGPYQCEGAPGLTFAESGSITGTLALGESARCTLHLQPRETMAMSIAIDNGSDDTVTAFPVSFALQRTGEGLTWYTNERLYNSDLAPYDGAPNDHARSGPAVGPIDDGRPAQTNVFRTGGPAEGPIVASRPLQATVFTAPGWAYQGVECTGDGGALSYIVDETGNIVITGTVEQNPSGTLLCTVTAAKTFPERVQPVVSCLAGNGRIDVNITNLGDTAHDYTLRVGALSPRNIRIAAGDTARTPVTGRPDGPITAQLSRDGELFYEDTFIIDCDDLLPTFDLRPMTGSEIQVLSACRSNNGFIAWNFTNPSMVGRTYIIRFADLPARSTSTAPNGAAVRGVSGRPDGTYTFTVEAIEPGKGPEYVYSSSVTVACD